MPKPRIGEIAPNSEAAVVDARKLVDYVLNPAHPSGRHKARVFHSVLGIKSADWKYLRDQLLAGLQESPLTRVNSASPPHVLTFGVDITVRGRNGQAATVTTAWKIHNGVPQLVSAYITP